MSENKVVAYMKDEKILTGFADVLGERNAKSYISSVLIAVRNNNALMACDPKSIYISALRAATMQLSVDPSVGQAYLVPFKGQCTLIVGYKGLYDMAIRTGKYRYIQVTKVYEGENVTEDRMTGLHTFEGFKESDKVVGWFASFQMIDGYTKTIYWTIEDIHAHAKEYSKSYDNANGLWQKNPAVMERKTILRALLTKWGYISPSDAHALLATEDEDEVVDVEYTEKTKKSAEENIKELGYDVPKWTDKQLSIVMKTTPHFPTKENAIEFMNESGMKELVVAGTVRKFVALYQGKRDSGMDHAEALQFAKDNI